jgi:hypothetical protein
MSIKKGIGYSELSDKIYLGKQNKEKGIWVGDKEDITNDFLNVCFAYFEEGNSRTINSKDKTNMFVNIRRDEESILKAIKYFEKQLTELKTDETLS